MSPLSSSLFSCFFFLLFTFYFSPDEEEIQNIIREEERTGRKKVWSGKGGSPACLSAIH